MTANGPSRIPGPKGSLLLGSLRHLRAAGPLKFWEDLWREYGDLASVRLGPMRAVLVVHPVHVEELLIRQAGSICKGIGYRDLRSLLGDGLITSENPLWRRQRHALQPAFTPAAVGGFDDVLSSAADQFAKRWRSLAEIDQEVELTSEMTIFAMSTLSRTIFDVDLQRQYLEVARAFDKCFALMAAKTSNPLSPPLAFPTRANREFKRNRALIDDFVTELMERSDVMARPNWVLERMVAAAGGEGAAVNRRQIRDEIVTLFFAGYETSARALTWTILLLLKNPSVMAALKDEVDRILGPDGPAADHVDALTTTRSVVQESLRLFPPAPIVARQNAVELDLGGYRIPRSSLIVVCPYLTHLHPDFWPDPNAFRPERFLNGGDVARPRCAYLPFGAGPRVCIGQHLALRELVITLASIIRGVDIICVGNGPVAPQFTGTLKPACDIVVRFSQRQPPPATPCDEG